MKIQAQTKAKPKSEEAPNGVPARGPVSVEYDIPVGVDGLRKAFGDEVVDSAARGAIVISLQAYMRRLLEKGKNASEIQAEVKGWKPDARTIVKQSAFERATGAVEKLSPEERKALIAKLQALK